MKKYKDTFTRHDKLTSELCDEIDMLNDKVDFWKTKYEKLNIEYNELLNSSIKHEQQMMGNLLTATLKGYIHPKEEDENKN